MSRKNAFPALPSTLEALEGRRAAAWIRVSTLGQADNFGPDAQRELIGREIGRLRLEDTGIEWEVAWSGLSIESSPEWEEMLSRAGADYDVLVVGYVSRFARNLKTAVNARDQLHARGAAVYFADDRILTSDERGWENWAKEAVDAEAYSRKLARRVREGYESKRRRTGTPGGNRPPYGFRREGRPARLVVHEDEMAVVREAFTLSASGMTDREVADAVSLKKAHVAEILTNPVYRGKLHRGEESSGGVQVEPALWDQVQERRSSFARRRPGRGTTRIYPLAKLLYCAGCGKLLTAHCDRFRHVDACETFKEARPRNLRWATRGESYASDLYDQIIPAVLQHVARGVDLLPELSDGIGSAADGPDPATLARIERERAAALSRYLLDRDARALDARMAQLDGEEAEARLRVRSRPSKEDARRFLSNLPYLWHAAGPAERQLLARNLFDRIDVLGVEHVRLHPSSEARRLGWFEAWEGRTLTVRLDAQSLRYGRGERI